MIVDYSFIGKLTKFGQGTGPIFASNMGCTGSERSLLDCRKSITGILSCQHFEDAGVVCLGMSLVGVPSNILLRKSGVQCMFIACIPIEPCENGVVKLSGSSDAIQGRIEVCMNEVWGTICADFWDVNDTAVICRQLGFSAEGDIM